MYHTCKITTSKRIVAFVLLFSQALMGCGGNFNAPRKDKLRSIERQANQHGGYADKEESGEKSILPAEVDSTHQMEEDLDINRQEVHLLLSNGQNEASKVNNIDIREENTAQQSIAKQVQLPTRELGLDKRSPVMELVPKKSSSLLITQAPPKREEKASSKYENMLSRQKSLSLHRDELRSERREAEVLDKEIIIYNKPSTLALHSITEGAPTSRPKSEVEKNPSLLLYAKGDHQVWFNHPSDKLVKVVVHIPVVSGTYPLLYLPVIYQTSGIDIEKLATYSIGYQQNRVRVCFPVNDPEGMGYVRIEDVGLKGGGKGIKIDVEELINTIVSGYRFLGIQPDAAEINSWRPFLNELANALAGMDLDLLGPRPPISINHYDPGSMRSTFEDIVKRASERNVRLENYGDACNHIVNEVRDKIKQRQSLDIDPSEYPTDSYEVSLQPNLFNMFSLSQEVNKVYAVREGSSVIFDLGKVLNVVNIVVTFNSSFSEFERRKRAEREEAEARRRNASYTSSSSSWNAQSSLFKSIFPNAGKGLEEDIKRHNQELDKQFKELKLERGTIEAEKASVEGITIMGRYRLPEKDSIDVYAGEREITFLKPSSSWTAPSVNINSELNLGGGRGIRIKPIRSTEIKIGGNINLSTFKLEPTKEEKEKSATESEGISREKEKEGEKVPSSATSDRPSSASASRPWESIKLSAKDQELEDETKALCKELKKSLKINKDTVMSVQEQKRQEKDRNTLKALKRSRQRIKWMLYEKAEMEKKKEQQVELEQKVHQVSKEIESIESNFIKIKKQLEEWRASESTFREGIKKAVDQLKYQHEELMRKLSILDNLAGANGETRGKRKLLVEKILVLLDEIVGVLKEEQEKERGGEKGATEVSEAGLNFIARHEGCSLSVYKDPVGIPTIGYGHKIGKGEVFDTELKPEETWELLKSDAEDRAAKYVRYYVKVKLKQHQFDALTSFTFNLGCGNLSRSTLLTDVNNEEHKKGEEGREKVRQDFSEHNSAKDKKTGEKVRLKGLESRREREAKLFLDGIYNW